MAKSKIEWTEMTWNPVTGCTKVSPGCLNCYAEKMANRLQAIGTPGYENGFKVTLHPERLDEPWRWRKPRRVFICSMGDLFHEDVKDAWLRYIFNAMWTIEPIHTYLILTKRPERMRDFFATWGEEWKEDWPNLWLGVTAENQEQANKRIPILLQTPAAKRFVSAEPMLESINISHHLISGLESWSEGHPESPNPTWPGGFSRKLHGIDGVIAGCESGPGRRPANESWFRDLRDQCVAAGIPFFLKQMDVNGKLVKMPELDGKVWQELAL